MSVTEDALRVATSERCDAEAFEDRLLGLFEAHHQRLYRLARRLVATGDEAGDLVPAITATHHRRFRKAKTRAAIMGTPPPHGIWVKHLH